MNNLSQLANESIKQPENIERLFDLGLSLLIRTDGDQRSRFFCLYSDTDNEQTQDPSPSPDSTAGKWFSD